ncbi:unnamed protein product [Clonostachys rosea]|uniref:mitogen-activated protein kinase n=1 Tax=Bionectria ochroleuca TaxID=29856 RepID=A0ABY6UTW2_BIOOC|nr:unnamed protein product [Clonostachys rosea]
MFQLPSNIDTSVIRQVIVNATPNRNINNVIDDFNQIADSMKSGPNIAGAVLTSLQQRLCGNNENWIERFKSLQLLDYLLHLANAETLPWAKQNADQIEGSMPIVQEELGRKRVAEEFRVIKLLLQDETRISEEVRADGSPLWLVRCYERPLAPRRAQRHPSSQRKVYSATNPSKQTPESGFGNMARQDQSERGRKLSPFYSPAAVFSEPHTKKAPTQEEERKLVHLCLELELHVLVETQRVMALCLQIQDWGSQKTNGLVFESKAWKGAWVKSLEDLNSLEDFRWDVLRNTLRQKSEDLMIETKVLRGIEPAMQLAVDGTTKLRSLYLLFDETFVKNRSHVGFISEEKRDACRDLLGHLVDRKMNFTLESKLGMIEGLLGEERDHETYHHMTKIENKAFQMRGICSLFSAVLHLYENDYSPRFTMTPERENQEPFDGLHHGNSNDHSAAWDSAEQTITSISRTNARSSQQPRWHKHPPPAIFGKRMERSEENLHATGLSFLSRENYDKLHEIFQRFVIKGAITIPKIRAFGAIREGIEIEKSQVDMVLSWCDVDQSREFFFPDFALAFYLLVLIASQQQPMGMADTGQLRAEVSRKVNQLTGGCSRRQFLERQRAQEFHKTELKNVNHGKQSEEEEFDETTRPDDIVTQVSVKPKRKKRRDQMSPPAATDSKEKNETVPHNNSRIIAKQGSRSGTVADSTPSGSFDGSRAATSDLVRDSKLETVISNNGALVQHITYESSPRMRQRRLRKEQTWKRVREIGGGGFGCVWLEERLDGDNGGSFRAVKEISKIQSKGQQLSINYNRELEAIAKFSHSKYVHCFVQSFGWYESEQAIFIAMEYMEQGDLQGYLSRPFPEEEAKQILYQLLEGLCFMHDNGFAHRDLKPANILVSQPSPHWWVKIGDFGISKRAEEEATAFRTLVGTRGYLAPEVMGIYSTEDVMGGHTAGDDSSSIYTVAVDIWALGAIMFRLLNNRNIFSDPHQLARYVTAKGPFPRDALLQRDVSRSCMEFLELAMARSPKDRPTSHQALEHVWLGDLHDSALPPEALMDRLSIASNSLTQRKVSVRNEDTAPSADWPSTFD